jgi:hypothetical protein
VLRTYRSHGLNEKEIRDHVYGQFTEPEDEMDDGLWDLEVYNPNNKPEYAYRDEFDKRPVRVLSSYYEN